MDGETIRVALDAMGGDNAPGEIIKGATEAVAIHPELHVTLVGREEVIKEHLKNYSYDAARISIQNATEEISCDEPPVEAVRRKRDSSLTVALNLVRHKECDAFVSAGSTGAILAGGQILVGRIRGIERTPLAPLIPTEKGVALLIDCGANVDARASQLVQYAMMGTIYMENVVGIKNPRVGIINIGTEEEKGNALVKETYPLLKALPGINFVGSVEAREIPKGAADIYVCEAFVGNVILKLYEGLAGTLMSKIKEGMLSTTRSKLGAMLVKPALKKTLKGFDTSEYGGAPMLGLNGLVVKIHGNSTSVETRNALAQCIAFVKEDIEGKIRLHLAAKTETE
ncbi:MAG: phosphate acyltransferase PlsX [Lachnospiraceae bacterium]|nr:phosphate acyltransferase PlsX [Lachnospiraceae bacterium]MCR5087431.1 phosphate acyltransferase PlsX [Lachnospiraceae bacterium]